MESVCESVCVLGECCGLKWLLGASSAFYTLGPVSSDHGASPQGWDGGTQEE